MMARIYAPRELLKDGKRSGLWHMTVKSDEEKWPAHAIGACAVDCPGHATPAEAYSHYDDGEAQRAQFGSDTDDMRRCSICEQWTTGRAITEWHVFPLCDAHRTADRVRELLRGERAEFPEKGEP